MTEKLGEDMLETVRKSIPLQRLGKPEEVAAMTRFLALDEGADYITGMKQVVLSHALANLSRSLTH